MSTRFDLFLARVSDDPAAAARFLKTLGLGAENSARSVVLHGRSGKVAIRSTVGLTGASAGDTRLSFVVSDVREAADALAKAGLSAVELNGRIRVREPRGGGVWINEAVPATHDSTQASSVDVIAVYYTTDFGSAAAFFACFGFISDGAGDGWWQALHAKDAGGVIGLHHAEETPLLRASPDDPIGPPATVDLGFETTEDLTALAQRLRDAGYFDAAVAEDNGLIRVQVTDPDGRRLEIHSAG